ncbi:MAG: elongation factor P--(R)-beta-lysine ligase, partial [Leptospira sp.]|nr:elongation factor P--(R)-beta-lysine ligase [Leptospira sp.]
EPYIDPFKVSSPHSEKEGYLITSPEYSLKQVLSSGAGKIFEIAHAFRSGEKGRLHTKEFLMLEFYQVNADEFALMDLCIELFTILAAKFHTFSFHPGNIRKIKMEELFVLHSGKSFSRSDLILTLEENKIKQPVESLKFTYDDLFFLVFLNLIEPGLEEGPLFIYDYPPELASLSRIENGRARRFEIYWKGIELGNAFYELTDPEEQFQRLRKEQDFRRETGKEVFEIDPMFISALHRGIPDVSGISIGLDRLFMLLLGHEDLRFISPYFEHEIL